MNGILTLTALASCLLANAAASQQLEFITNGGFETGDASGWDLGSGTWTINDGTLDPMSAAIPQPTIGGGYDLMTDPGGPSESVGSQSFVVPPIVLSATLSWSDRIQNFANQFADPGQEFRVLVLDATGALIQEVFSTNPNDPLIQLGPNPRSFDLTSLLQGLASQAITISFEEQDSLNYFNVTIDDVSLIIDTPNRLAQFTTFGQPCLGLTHDAVANDRPIIGQTFDLTVRMATSSPPTIGFLMLGLRQTAVSPAVTGFASCLQYTSAEITQVFAPSGLVSVVSVSIPNRAFLIGFQVYSQAAVYSPNLAFPPFLLGISLSEGGALLIGDY